MKIVRLVQLFTLLSAVHVADAFQPQQFQNRLTRAAAQRQPTVALFMSSQWDDEEDTTKETTKDAPKDATKVKRSSFDDAGQQIRDEEDQESLDSMGDYDRNPSYKRDNVDRIRDAIRARADEMGIEKSEEASPEAIAAAAEKARADIEARRGSVFDLDLTQISDDTSAVDNDDDETPSMFYDAEAMLSEEQQAEADPTGQLPIMEQVKVEWAGSEWPDFFTSMKQMVILFAVIFITGGLIVTWDNFLRETYTDIGFVPRQEDVMKGMDNMVLPEGWLNGMSEQDVINFQNEIAAAAGGASSALPDISSSESFFDGSSY
mmetsp:Transcript_2978/g.8151  ORF Transcript_2978/g.8151 Transcript_2978/m.8151 type:complete len:319 (-) Transcript_2978:963-1919(-)